MSQADTLSASELLAKVDLSALAPSAGSAECPTCMGDGWETSEYCECPDCLGSGRETTPLYRAAVRLQQATNELKHARGVVRRRQRDQQSAAKRLVALLSNSQT